MEETKVQGKLSDSELQDLERRFGYHKPSSPEIADAHETVRKTLLWTAEVIEEIVPPGREQSLALTKLEEAMFWANAGIARTQQVGNRKDGVSSSGQTPTHMTPTAD